MIHISWRTGRQVTESRVKADSRYGYGSIARHQYLLKLRKSIGRDKVSAS